MLRDLCLLKSFQADVKRKQTYADIFSSMFCIKLQSHFTHPSLFTGDEQLKKNKNYIRRIAVPEGAARCLIIYLK